MADFYYNAKSAHTVYFHPSPKRVRVKKSIEDVKIKNKKKKIRFLESSVDGGRKPSGQHMRDGVLDSDPLGSYFGPHKIPAV